MVIEHNQNAGVGAESQSPHAMPPSWKRPGMYQFQYQHASCPGATFSITCVPLGPILMVHGT